MAVTILLQKPDGSHIATFVAEDKQSIAQLAKKNGVDFPISCGIGLCWICKCKIISWHEHIQIDKITVPMKPLGRDQNGLFTEVFACVGGINTESINSPEQYKIVLEKNM